MWQNSFVTTSIYRLRHQAKYIIAYLVEKINPEKKISFSPLDRRRAVPLQASTTHSPLLSIPKVSLARRRKRKKNTQEKQNEVTHSEPFLFHFTLPRWRELRHRK